MPVLCPDPCGPTGTAPRDGQGADLQDFAEALRAELTESSATCVIASADLSHIGAFFGDSRHLTEDYLQEVQARDRSALARVVENDPQRYVAEIASNSNATRMCSVGCIYALMTALPDARGRQLEYHQAVDQDEQCSVSCAAVAFERVV